MSNQMPAKSFPSAKSGPTHVSSVSSTVALVEADAPPSLASTPSNAPSNTSLSNASPAPSVSFSTPCKVSICNDNSASATIYIDPEILRRLKNRAESQNLSEYLWNNVFRRALESYVY